MADEEQVKILKQGAEVWNKWRRGNETAKIDLVEANLNGVDLSGAHLWESDLREAHLKKANLNGANLSGANLFRVDLSGADLRKANLREAHLKEAHLKEADLRGANLNGVDLRGANLFKANLDRADFSGVDLSIAQIGETIFANIDLSETHGLEEAQSWSASTIGTDTIQLSKGKIPEAFLRGCGLSDWEIESAKLYNPDLTNEEIVEIEYRIHDLRTTRAIKVSPLFISYSHTDSAFVNKLEKGLNAKGVRFWRDIHDMKAGKIETQIDRAIRQNPTVLLILSKNSTNSDWVQHEVRKARELEKEFGQDTLCPIALDDGWKSSHWPQRVMEQVMEYNILDFSKWEDESTFNAKFAKLLNGLDLFYKKPEA